MTSAEQPAGPMRCAVVGDPIDHSLSPVLHRAGYEALGLAARYDAVRVPAGGLASYVAGLGPQWRGLSVTAPLKREALALAEEASATARLAGGANTLVRTETGWRADNTDVPGAVAAIRERCTEQGLTGPLRSATILGAGATAASISIALAEIGVTTVDLAVRDVTRAEETRAAIAAIPGGPRVQVVQLDQAPCADVLVSTVPAAAQTPALATLGACCDVVFEVTYDHWPTPIVEAAQDLGHVVVSGLDLLVHQAVLQFAQFTGHDGPWEAMRKAGESALAAR